VNSFFFEAITSTWTWVSFLCCDKLHLCVRSKYHFRHVQPVRWFWLSVTNRKSIKKPQPIFKILHIKHPHQSSHIQSNLHITSLHIHIISFKMFSRQSIPNTVLTALALFIAPSFQCSSRKYSGRRRVYWNKVSTLPDPGRRILDLRE
jgi:hypothetical protein